MVPADSAGVLFTANPVTGWLDSQLANPVIGWSDHSKSCHRLVRLQLTLSQVGQITANPVSGWTDHS